MSLAVLLIDMQDYFLSVLGKKEKIKIITNQIEIIRLCAKNDIPLIVLEWTDCYSTIETLRKEIKKIPRTITIRREPNDGFIKTDLLLHLNIFCPDYLLLTGIHADACVLATANSAINHGYKIITTEELISCHNWKNNTITKQWYMENGIFCNQQELLTRIGGKFHD